MYAERANKKVAECVSFVVRTGFLLMTICESWKEMPLCDHLIVWEGDLLVLTKTIDIENRDKDPDKDKESLLRNRRHFLECFKDLKRPLSDLYEDIRILFDLYAGRRSSNLGQMAGSIQDG